MGEPILRRQTDDYGPQLTYTIWLLTALAAVFLALRIFCKLWRHRSVWWDDYILIASWVGANPPPPGPPRAGSRRRREKARDVEG